MLIESLSEQFLQDAEDIREDIHRHPELGYEEERTASLVSRLLEEAGLDQVRSGVGGTGVVGLLRGAKRGRTVALRADMDALPILEQTGLPYASENEGVMHACGHDGHVAVLLSVARLLADRRQSLPGDVKFIFQPAEEGGGGGRRMMQEGALDDPHADAIFALHGYSGVEPGQIALSPTPTAAMLGFRMEIKGRGGHGSMPNTTVDPIMIGSEIVVAAQTVVSRETHPARPAVISFCAFQAGTKENIIPPEATLLGTIRAVEMDVLYELRAGLERIATGVAETLRGSVTIEDIGVPYPPVKNDPELLDLVRRVGTELLGRQNVVEMGEQRMGAEDFAFFLAEQGGVPGIFFRVGVRSDENLHTAQFDFGSEALEPAILMMANVANEFLAGRAAGE